MTAPFHPLLICLMRELCEADEAYRVTDNVSGIKAHTDEWEITAEYMDWRVEYWDRCDNYENSSEALLAHLLLMPHHALDTSAYERLWAESLALPEDERENGKLWDAAEDVARRAIELYRGMK